VEKISLEPSALAGMPGVFKLFHTADGKHYLEKHALRQHMPNAIHIVWATGGSMVPPDVMEAYYRKGVQLSKKDA
jgi:D-serine dehydratase